MKGLCIDTGLSMNLEKGKEYFLFPAGSSSNYVSNFNNPGAHFGCYQAKYFKRLDPAYHIGIVSTPRNGYTLGDKFIIGPSKHAPYFDVYLLDGRIVGSYIENFFDIGEGCELPIFVPKIAQSVPKEPESVPIKQVVEELPQIVEPIKPISEQLSLF